MKGFPLEQGTLRKAGKEEERGMVGRFSETVGQYLKREREARSVSLVELSRATRMGLPLLEALERNDFGCFSQQEFIVGFLKGYARHLGLDVEEVLGRYRIQAELMCRREDFQQLSLFPGPPGPAGQIQDSPPGPSPVQKSFHRKSPYRRVFLQVTLLIAALGLSCYFHQTLKNSAVREDIPTPPGTIPPNRAKVRTQVRGELSQAEEKGESAAVKEKRRIMANRERRVYYLSPGREFEKLSPAQRIEFNSEEEAIKAGYRRASP
jgi:cytoskeletal protein RodZ